MNTPLAPRFLVRATRLVAALLWIPFITPCPATAATVTVSDVAGLVAAVSSANNTGGNVEILLEDGTYTLATGLYIGAPNITLRSVSGNRETVVIEGDAMSESASVGNVFTVAADRFTLSDVTLQKSKWHLIQIQGEADADFPTIRNCILRDAFEQMIKVSVNVSDTSISSDGGLVENCLFEYSAGIGPQYYIGGIDAHAARNWIVRDNTFRNIISPSVAVAEYAIHFWNDSADNLVERNLIIDCDRGIGFGLNSNGNQGGIIRNNMIYHAAGKGQFADVGIAVHNSPVTLIYNNTVFMEHAYPAAIEYRFPGTVNVEITNNLANRSIQSRDGATGIVSGNTTDVSADAFVDTAAGDLHLAGYVAGVTDTGTPIAGLDDDFDGDSRPQAGGIDIGADEYVPTQTISAPLVEKDNLIYQGAFRVPGGGGSENETFDYGGTAVAYNPLNNSLFLVGHTYAERTAEISIPPLVNSGNLDDLNTATILQPFADATEGKRNDVNPTDPNDQPIGGQLVYNGKLYLTVYSYYDAGGTQSASHFARPLDLSATGGVDGPVRVGAIYPGWVSGYMATIPAAWRAAFGGPALTGNYGLAIAGQQSWGPAASVFDPEAVGQLDPVPATLLVGYTANNSVLGGGWSETSVFYNGSTKGDGLVFPGGTRSVLFFGRQGIGEFCYGSGEECGDPANGGQGAHAYPYRYQVWAYDANDLISVKNGEIGPGDVVPYSIWNFNVPLETDDEHLTGGVGYDSQNGLIYFSQLGGDQSLPVIHVFRIFLGPRPRPPENFRVQ